MAYKSDINLRLGETPKTTDPAIFPDMLEVYNAIHILAQWVNAFKDIGNSGDENTPPWEAMPFRNYFYTPAAQSIVTGSVITIVGFDKFSNDAKGSNPYNLTGAINGAFGGGLSYQNANVKGFTWPLYGGPTGFALSDAEPGQLVKFGVGPAIIKLEGIGRGEPIFAFSAYTPYSRNTFSSGRDHYAHVIGQGQLVRLAKEGNRYAFPSNPVLIGIGVAPDAMMFNPNQSAFGGGLQYYVQESTSVPSGGGDN